MNKTLRQEYEISKDKLRRNFDPSTFKFETTEELDVSDNLEKIIGQEKAVKSIRHGLEMHDKYNNIFVTGSLGTEKEEIIRTIIEDYINNLSDEEYQKKLEQKKDLIAVYNPEDANKPKILDLPTGKGENFAKQMGKVTDYVLNKGIAEYKQTLKQKSAEIASKQKLVQDTIVQQKNDMNKKFVALQDEITRVNMNLSKMEETNPEYQKLLDKIEQVDQEMVDMKKEIVELDKKSLEEIAVMQVELGKHLKSMQDSYRTERITPSVEKLRHDYGADQETIFELEGKYLHNKKSWLMFKTKAKTEELTKFELKIKKKVEKEQRVLEKKLKKSKDLKKYFDQLEEELAKDAKLTMQDEDAKQLLGGKQPGGQNMMVMGMGMPMMQGGALPPLIELSKYEVNLLNKLKEEEQIRGIPLIIEKEPNAEKLFGKVEFPKMGAGMIIPAPGMMPAEPTDAHMRLKAGSLAKATGGYLLSDMMAMLEEEGIFSFQRLIKHLEKGTTTIEDVIKNMYMRSSGSSEEVEINTKVLMTGGEGIYQQLLSIGKHGIFEKFDKTFKVKAQFSPVIYDTPENRAKYINFLAAKSEEEGFKPLTAAAVSEVLDFAVKESGRVDQLTTKTDSIVTLLREADKESNEALIRTEHIKKAIDERIDRHSLLAELYQDYINNGTKIVNTEGEKVGQLNGLAVLGLEDMMFGIPSKITICASKGSAGIISLDQVAGTTGSSFKKSVATISQNLKGLFGQDKLISLAAGISFEQNYGGIDGDSATLAMYLGLMSELSGYPIDQGIAVTGSMDQRREIVQPIGGVSQKVEGFYKICKGRGLTGEQGCIIPKINEDHLMLSDEVIESIEKGEFHIYPVITAEEAIEVIMGRKACEYYKNGAPKFTKGTVYNKVDKKIKKYNKGSKEEKSKEKKEEPKEDKCDGCGGGGDNPFNLL